MNEGHSSEEAVSQQEGENLREQRKNYLAGLEEVFSGPS